jgi:chromosome segregation ATPase
MNVDINKYLKKISDMKAYRKGSEEDIERYRKRIEEKLAALNAQLKDAEAQSTEIKQTRLSAVQERIEDDNAVMEQKLTESQSEFDANKERIVQDIFDELFVS